MRKFWMVLSVVAIVMALGLALAPPGHESSVLADTNEAMVAEIENGGTAAINGVGPLGVGDIVVAKVACVGEAHILTANSTMVTETQNSGELGSEVSHSGREIVGTNDITVNSTFVRA